MGKYKINNDAARKAMENKPSITVFDFGKFEKTGIVSSITIPGTGTKEFGIKKEAQDENNY